MPQLAQRLVNCCPWSDNTWQTNIEKQNKLETVMVFDEVLQMISTLATGKLLDYFVLPCNGKTLKAHQLDSRHGSLWLPPKQWKNIIMQSRAVHSRTVSGTDDYIKKYITSQRQF